MNTSSHVGEDVMSSDELGVVIGGSLLSIVVLGFRDGMSLSSIIVQGFHDGMSWVSSGAATLSSSEFWKLVFPQSR